MSNIKIDLEKMALDEAGRVVLSDEMLDEIADCENVMHAGANSLSCVGSHNGNCTNSGACTGSTNSQSCTNENYCQFASDFNNCVSPDEVPEG